MANHIATLAFSRVIQTGAPDPGDPYTLCGLYRFGRDDLIWHHPDYCTGQWRTVVDCPACLLLYLAECAEAAHD